MVDELWRERQLRGSSLKTSMSRKYDEKKDKRRKFATFEHSLQVSMFPSHFTNELKVIRTSIFNFLNNTKYCIALEESPTVIGGREAPRKLYMIPFTKLNDLNEKRKEWEARLDALNKSIENYLSNKGPKGKPTKISYAMMKDVLEKYGIRLTDLPVPTPNFLPAITYRFSAHTISSSPGLKEKALKAQPAEAKSEIAEMLAESDNVVFESTLAKFAEESVAAVKDVLEDFEKKRKRAAESGRGLAEQLYCQTHKQFVKPSEVAEDGKHAKCKVEKVPGEKALQMVMKQKSLDKLEVLRNLAHDYNIEAIVEPMMNEVRDYIEKTDLDKLNVVKVMDITGRVSGL
jgi:hypothetical protein